MWREMWVWGCLMLKREICSTLAVRNCLGSTQCFIRVDEGSLKRVHWTHDYLCGKTSFSAPKYTPLPFAGCCSIANSLTFFSTKISTSCPAKYSQRHSAESQNEMKISWKIWIFPSDYNRGSKSPELASRNEDDGVRSKHSRWTETIRRCT